MNSRRLFRTRFGLWVLTSTVSVYVRPSVHPCVNPELVRAIMCVPFKPGTQNLDQKCKTPCLWPLLFKWWLTLTFKVKFHSKVNVNPLLRFFRTTTRHQSKLGSLNLDRSCKIPWLGSLFWGRVTLTFNIKFNFQNQKFILSILTTRVNTLATREIYNSHGYLYCITVHTVSLSPSSALTNIPRPLHRLDCFRVSTLRTYTDKLSQCYFGV